MDVASIIGSHLWDLLNVRDRGPETALYVFRCRSCEAQSSALGPSDGPPPTEPTARPGETCPDALFNVVLFVHDR